MRSYTFSWQLPLIDNTFTTANNHHHTAIFNLNEETEAKYKDKISVIEINTYALVVYLATNFQLQCRASLYPSVPESLF